MNNFDIIAPVYDFLAKLVFGRALIHAQTYFLYQVKARSKILIIGGGTGQILHCFEDLSRPLSIVYVEKSARMLDLAKKRGPFANLEIRYVHGDERSVPPGKYDVIATVFFLDVFSEKHLVQVIQLLNDSLKKSGKWLVTDFVNTPVFWQKWLVKLMYWFFKITANLESNTLLDFEAFLTHSGLKRTSYKSFYYNMMQSAVYEKTGEITPFKES
ncbi:MAG: class I SAM-dependent methyltransferase [Bacteroidota bacterium]